MEEINKQELLNTISPAVKAKLKAPLTAIFCSPEELDIAKREQYFEGDNDNIYIVRGHVNSQNSFGALIKTNFKVKAQLDNGNWKIMKTSVGNFWL